MAENIGNEVKFVHFAKKADFTTALQTTYADAIVFVADTQEIFTHGKFYWCGAAFTQLSDGSNTVKTTSAEGVITIIGSEGITATVSADGISIQHANKIQAGKTTDNTAGTLNWGNTINVPTIDYDANGHIKSATNRALKMPDNPASGLVSNVTSKIALSNTSSGTTNTTSTSNTSTFITHVEGQTVNSYVQLKGDGATTITGANGVITISSTDTDTKVTSAANHYPPSAVNASNFSGATNKTITSMTRDDKGHIVEIVANEIDLPKYNATLGTASSSSATATAAGTNIVLLQNGANKGGISLTGIANKVSVTSDASGTIKFSLPDNVALTGTPTAPTANEGTSTTQIATTAFVQNAVNKGIANLDGALKYIGTIGTASGAYTATLPAASGASVGDVYIAVSGCPSVNGKAVEAGDMIICQAISGTTVTWNVVQTNIDGAVTGPASSTIDHVALFSDTSGKVIKDGTVGRGLNVSSNTLGHANTASTKSSFASSSTALKPSHGGTFTYRDVQYDAYGHISNSQDVTVTLPTVSVTDSSAALSWDTSTTIATVEGTNITAKLPANPNVTSKIALSDTSSGTTNVTTLVNNPFINHVEGTTVNTYTQIKGGGSVTVSGQSGVITISGAMYANATSTLAGLVKLGSDTTQTVAAQTVSSASGRTYAIQTNSSGNLVVNVPWTDNDTTYTGDTYVTVSGTKISHKTYTAFSPTTTAATVDFGGTINIPKVTVDTGGHVSSISNQAVTLPTMKWLEYN